MKKGQSNRLTVQQKQGQGPITIFHKDAQIHDREVGNTSLFVKKQLEFEFPMLTFRYRKDLYKKEINEALKKVDEYLGQTLFVESASIRPDGGLIEVQDDNGDWRVVLVSEAKHQGKDIENIRAGKLVGKNSNQDLMAAGNAIERAYKNVNEIANFMLSETCVLLSKLKVDQHIEVELQMDELDLTAAESKATYEEIKAYVLEKFGLKVSQLYIAQIKRKCGIIERKNYNVSKKEDAKVPTCPPEKEAAIMDAFKHFQMI